jgi:large subunit ribosomal protein L35
MATTPGKCGKQKNRSTAKKRFSKTGSGKWKVEKAAHNHLLLQKSKRQKNASGKPILLSKGDAKRAQKMLPSF